MTPSMTLATDWIQVGTGLGTDTKSLILVVLIPLAAVFFVLVVAFKTRAPGPTIMTTILAGIVVGLSLSITLMGNMTSQTITHYEHGGSHFSGADQ
ncbi:hypothetical protein [Streptomyces sp. 8L]|uniref:hypothetical protein n=1 Tax=Streptomyces sp. 8L TaxID=2877242 RepID=UPI001CD54220|nr:hypothetical protein [Streptomyces sp. 8L]MCA1219299.1 hypothetical protein [Streptomyces sp. 8L]